jgi:hypothetical protein
MAWRPPMAPKSMPYWKGDMETRVHAAKHFQLDRRLEVRSGMAAVLMVLVVRDSNECDDVCSKSRRRR